MKQVRNFMTRDEIVQELKTYDNEKHLESPAHLEYQARQFFYSGDYEISLDCISKAIELNPSYFAYFKRSQVYLKLNEPDNALEDLETCLIMQPEYQNAIDLKELILSRIAENRKYYGYIYG